MKPLDERPVKDRLVYVEWCDARGVTTNWTDLEDLKESDTCVCISIGILLTDKPECVVILPHFSADPQNGCGEMTIPRTQVRRMWALKVGKELKV